MNIEKGEYFAITRGVKLRSGSPFSIFSMLDPTETWKTKDSEEEHYDRSWHDCVFEAIEVCYPMVAAKVVAGRKAYTPEVLSLNLSEIEIMTLTETYVKTLTDSEKQNKEQLIDKFKENYTDVQPRDQLLNINPFGFSSQTPSQGVDPPPMGRGFTIFPAPLFENNRSGVGQGMA